MTDNANGNRNVKASVFSSLFSEYPRELPKIIADIPDDTEIENVTLDDVLFMKKINDL